MGTQNFVRILEVKENWFSNTVVLETIADRELVLDSFLGQRLFYLKKGKRRRIKLHKRIVLYAGDTVSFSDICTSGLRHNAFDNFQWCWSV